MSLGEANSNNVHRRRRIKTISYSIGNSLLAVWIRSLVCLENSSKQFNQIDFIDEDGNNYPN